MRRAFLKASNVSILTTGFHPEDPDGIRLEAMKADQKTT